MTISIDRADIAALRAAVRGTVSRPRDPGYATAGFNLAVSRRPWAVIDVADTADIAATLRFAADNAMTVAVHNTGHGATSIDGDSLLIRTTALDRCDVDATSRTARIGAGVRWQTVLDRAAAYGLAPAAGSAPGVGVTGFLTGGGVGPFVRSFGVSSDHVRSFEVVTGDGRVRHASARENPDLFWGLRGGKATLGIVGETVIDLLPVSEFYGGAIYFDGQDADQVAGRWARWTAGLPPAASTSLALLQIPDVPGVPPMLAGRSVIAVRFASLDAAATAAAQFAPIRSAATALLDDVDVKPYAALGAIHADPVDPMPVVERSALLGSLDGELVSELVRCAGPGSGTMLTMVEIRLLGGAVAETPAVPSAFCHRHAAANLMVIGALVPPIADVVDTHVARVLDAMAPWATGGELPNFGAASDPARARRCYDEDTYAWLAALGTQYDPNGVLNVGQVAR